MKAQAIILRRISPITHSHLDTLIGKTARSIWESLHSLHASGTGEIYTLKRDDLVIKLAFEEQKTRIQHESTVYAHLAKQKVTGVATVHGLFNDPDSGTHAGRNLREREREPTGENFPEKNGMSSLDRDWGSLASSRIL